MRRAFLLTHAFWGVRSLRQVIVSQNGSIPRPESNSEGYWWSGYGAVYQKGELQESTWPGNFLQHLESMAGWSAEILATREQDELYSPWRKTIAGQFILTSGQETYADWQMCKIQAYRESAISIYWIVWICFKIKTHFLSHFRRPPQTLPSTAHQSSGLACEAQHVP